MRNAFILAGALVIAGTLVSGHVDLNFEHNIHLPKELTNQTSLVKTNNLFSKNKLDVYLKDEITTMHDFQDLYIALDKLKSGDSAVFHLAGYGGNVQTLNVILSHIESAKNRGVFIKMLVEADVYSAHAFLATVADDLIVAPNAFLYFHNYSTFGTDCSKNPNAKNMDRADTIQQVCELLMKEFTRQSNAQIDSIPNTILSPAGKERVKAGHAVAVYYKNGVKVEDTTSAVDDMFKIKTTQTIHYILTSDIKDNNIW